VLAPYHDLREWRRGDEEERSERRLLVASARLLNTFYPYYKW